MTRLLIIALILGGCAEVTAPNPQSEVIFDWDAEAQSWQHRCYDCGSWDTPDGSPGCPPECEARREADALEAEALERTTLE